MPPKRKPQAPPPGRPRGPRGVPKSRERQGGRKPQVIKRAVVVKPASKRPPRRKGETWREWWRRWSQGTKIPVLDPVCDWAAYIVAPPSTAWPSDPRHRARNLGRVVDGLTGWVCDVAGHIPVVGNAARPALRIAAHVVRGAEDVINMATTPLGFSLFVLSVLSVVGGVSHWCPEANRITNCCEPREIAFCTETLCWHRHGCVPCTDKCWVPVGVTWSAYNTLNRYDLWRHLDLVAGLVYVCDTLDIGEYCAVGAIAAEVVVDTIQYHHTFTCNHTCYMFVEPTGATAWFFEFVSADWSWLRVLLDTLEGAPGLLSRLIAHGPGPAVLVLLAYVINGHITKAIVLMFLLSYANASVLPFTEEPHTECPPINNYEGTALCFTPAPFIVGQGYPWPANTRGCVWDKEWTVRRGLDGANNSWGMQPIMGQFRYDLVAKAIESLFHDWSTFGNVSFDVPVPKKPMRRASCFIPSRARLRGRCTGWMGDLTTGESWEDCGKGMVLTKCAVVHSVFANQSWPVYPAWANGLRYFIAVDPSDRCKALNWTLRLPGSPEVVSFQHGVRPLNHHFAVGEAATGYLQFSVDGKHQVLSGGKVLSPFPHLHDSLLLFCFCILVRARYVTLLLGLYLCYTSADAALVREWGVVAAAAAAPPLAPAIWWCDEIGFTTLLILLIPWFCQARLHWYVLAAVIARSTVHSDVMAWQGDDPGWTLAWVLAIVGWIAYPLAKRHRAAVLWLVAYTRARGYHYAEGLAHWHWKPGLVALACVFPHAALTVLVGCACIALALETLLALVEWAFLHNAGPRRVSELLTQVYRTLGGASIPILCWILRKAGDRGVWLYEHLHDFDAAVLGALKDVAVWSDPLMLEETEVRYIRDSAREVACGDVRAKLPVVARMGDMVMLGWNSRANMKGWRLSAPFRADLSMHTSWFKTLALSVHGKDTRTHSGQIAVLGTGLKGSMGFGYGNALVTCYHSSRAKTLSSPSGPVMPLAINVPADMVVYPLPPGMTCLERCTCGEGEAWVFDRHGGVHRGEIKNKEVLLTSPVPVSYMKGASGSPVLCKQAHAIGVLKSVKHVRGSAGRVCYSPLEQATALKQVLPDSTNADPPAVPKNYEVRVLHAPTGSGKTTKIPMSYVGDGYKVLVLNPSVATTLSMGPYMQKAYGISPNIYTGETTLGTGQPLTYATYGKVAALDTTLLQGVDVVICDECHDVTSTTVLGIGHVLLKAESCGVKLVVLATATPPGCVSTPHHNITEVALGHSGEVPFYGRKLEIQHYTSGRHLIFCTAKHTCDTLASLLKGHGLTAVAYYRGEPVSKIPETGDVVVCATDALMTGYTGNFDSVTDCNLSVGQDIEIDLNPTFTVALRTKQADSVCRMQRRGRTGRGRPGIYRYVDTGEACSGIVPEAAVVEAYDQAYAWLAMSAAQTTPLLRAYATTPGLPVVNGDFEMWESFFSAMRPDSGLLERVKARADSFPTITAMQWTLSTQLHAPLPGREGRWMGHRYKTGKCPLLVHLDCDKDQEWHSDHPLIETLAQCLGLEREEPTNGWGVLVAGGVALGLAVLIDGTASLVVVGHIGINRDHINTVPPEVLFELEPKEAEECGIDLLAAKEQFLGMLSQMKEQANSYFAMAQTSSGAAAADAYTNGILVTLNAWINDICSAGAVGLGLATIRNNAPLACAHAFVAGLLSSIPLGAKAILAMAAGAVASTLTTSKPACAFTAAAIVGGGFATLSLGGVLASLFTGYAGAVAGANVTYIILQGKMPALDDLGGLLAGVFNPGAVVAGVVTAVILKKGIADRNVEWMNRLLAMLSKTNIVPANYFLENEDLVAKMAKMLKGLTPVELFKAFTNWLEKPEVSECSGGWFKDLMRSLVTLVYRFLSGLVAWIKTHLPYPRIGMLSCDVPYRGEWAGKGSVVTVCGCGKKNTFRVDGGYVTPAAVAKTCWCFWTGGVPINGSTVLKGVTPSPSQWKLGLVVSGWGDWYRVERRMGSYYITGVYPQTLDIDLKVPAPADLAYVEGARCAAYAPEVPELVSDFATINGMEVTLPITIEKLAAMYKTRKEEEAKNACEKKVFGLTLTPVCEHEENTILKQMMEADQQANPNGPAQMMTPTPGIHYKPKVENAESISSGLGESVNNDFQHETLPNKRVDIPPGAIPHVDIVGALSAVTAPLVAAVGNMGFPCWPLNKCADTQSVSSSLEVAAPSVGGSDPASSDVSGLPPRDPQAGTLTFGGPGSDVVSLHSADGAVSGPGGQHSGASPPGGLRRRRASKASDSSGPDRPALVGSPTLESTTSIVNPAYQPIPAAGQRELPPPESKLAPFPGLSPAEVSVVTGVFGQGHQLSAGTFQPISPATVMPGPGFGPERTGGRVWMDSFITVTECAAVRSATLQQLPTVGVQEEIPMRELARELEDPPKEICPPALQRGRVTPTRWHSVTTLVFSTKPSTTQSAEYRFKCSQCESWYTTKEDASRCLYKDALLDAGHNVSILTPDTMGERGEDPRAKVKAELEAAVTYYCKICKAEKKSLTEAIDCQGSHIEDRVRGAFSPRRDETPRPPMPVGTMHEWKGKLVWDKPAEVAPKVRQPLEFAETDEAFCASLFSYDSASEWETEEEVEETSCNYSYVWSGFPISTRQIGKRPLPIRYLTSGLGKFRQLVYWSEPAQAEERKAKVTYFRSPETDPILRKVREFAILAASRVNERGLSFDEAALMTPPKSATSCLSRLTAASVRARTSEARKLCTEAYNDIGKVESKYNMVTVMPKVEIFVRTPEKPTMKPPRLIAYPPLEMRVAEKMVLGRIAPAAVKAVLKSAYGFQYTPWERVSVLVKWWQSRKAPMAFACDTVCFDSTVTSADVAFESAVYAAATRDTLIQAKIWGLGNTLYSSSPMYSQSAQYLGTRHCRASGVFTTSSSNCLTAYTKARAAAVHAGLKNPQFLVHGDDIICICDSFPTPAEDAAALNTFAVWMKKYGCPQGQIPVASYSLEEIESCSSNVSYATDLKTNKPYYYLTRDPLTPLGRAMAEAVDRTVSQTWIGNLILHYPAIWASRVLMVHLLDQIETLADATNLTINIWGTEYTIDLTYLPYLIDKLHGEGARRLAYFTPAEVTRISDRLKTLGYPPLRAWKAKARMVRVRLLRRGGKFAFLARHLLWFAAGKLPPPLEPTIARRIDFKLPTFASPDGYLRQSADLVSVSGTLLTSVSCCFLFAIMLTLVHLSTT